MTGRLHRPSAHTHEVRLPVMGVWTTFTSNAPDALVAVEEAFGSWARAELDPAVTSASDAVVRVEVVDGIPEHGAGGAYRHFAPDRTRLLALMDGGFGVADTQRTEALLFVTDDLLSRRSDFVGGMLEAATLFLLGALDRQPVHAAAVAREGVAILLAGPSGSGKSTLTYAASRRGFVPLADEPVFVQLEPVLRVWGRRSRIHLMDDARVLFPELQGSKPVDLPTGKSKLVVEPDPPGEPYAERPGLCILRRSGEGGSRLEPLTKEAAVTEMMEHLDEGYDLFADTIGERIAAIADHGAWRLTVAGSPDEAVELLEAVAAELRRPE